MADSNRWETTGSSHLVKEEKVAPEEAAAAVLEAEGSVTVGKAAAAMADWSPVPMGCCLAAFRPL